MLRNYLFSNLPIGIYEIHKNLGFQKIEFLIELINNTLKNR